MGTDPVRHSDREVRTAAAAAVAAGLAALGLALFADRVGIGAGGGEFGWKQVGLLVVGGLVVTGGTAVLIRPGLVSAPDHAKRLRAVADRVVFAIPIFLFVVLGIVLMWTRLVHIDASVWHDEAVSIEVYNTFDTAIDLKASHVLYNLLSLVTSEVLGDSEAVHRAWSVFPAIAAVGLAAWWAWRRIGAVTAVAFATLAVAAPMHLDLAPQARGYGLGLLAATLMVIAADHLTRNRTRAMILGFLGTGLLGTWTLVFFALAFVGQTLALAWWPHLRRVALTVLAVLAGMSLLFYLPLFESGSNPVTLWNQAIEGGKISVGSALLLERTLEWLVIPTATLLSGPPTADAVDFRLAADWVDPTAFVLLAVGVAALWRRREIGLALLLVLPPLVFNVGFAALDLTTVPRHQFVLLTHVLILVAVGIAEVGTLVARHWALRPVAIAAGVLAVLALSRETVQEEQARAVPLENFKQVGEIVRETGIETVVTDSVRPEGLRYYLGDDFGDLPPSEIEPLLCDRDLRLVYIRHLPISPLDPAYVSPPSLECARRRGGVRIRVPQRGRGGMIDVWILDGRAADRASSGVE